MRRYLWCHFLAAVLCPAVNVLAQGPGTSGNYYEPANGKKGAELKTALSGIIYNRTERTYGELWTDFRSTDVRDDGYVWDMYSCVTNFEFGTHQDKGTGGKTEGEFYNREHSFPNSWFGGKIPPMYTDLHHVYPTDKMVNNKRGNSPFGETDGSWTSAEGFSKLGPCTYPGYTGTVFEPNDVYKGDFARTYFYMVTCYEEKLTDWYANYAESQATLDGQPYPGLSAWQLDMLMTWAKNDPVSEKETARNEVVYAIQHNRNPFIDYQGLEDYIWGDKTGVPFSYDHFATGIFTARTDSRQSAAETIFSPDGKRLRQLQHGLNIVRRTDGRVLKVVK